MKPLDYKILQRFLKSVGDHLTGDWVIIGGTVLPLLGVDFRSTVDIDIVHLQREQSNQQLLELMSLTEKLGLPIETINQAGALFLHRIPHFQEHLVSLHRGKEA